MTQTSSRSEGLKYLKTLHWYYNFVMFDGVFKIGDFILLTLVSIMVLAASAHLFSQRGIPASNIGILSVIGINLQ